MVFLIVVVLAIAGTVVLIGKFVIPKEKPDTEPVQNAVTENPTMTEYVEPPAPEPVDDTPERAAQIVAGMTLEDKVAQMFVVTPNALTGFSGVTAAGDTTREAYNSHPVGGLIYMGDNLTGREQTTTMLTNMQAFAMERTGLPVFLGVDEEGGRVARIAGNAEFGATNVGDMATIGATGDPQNTDQSGQYRDRRPFFRIGSTAGGVDGNLGAAGALRRRDSGCSEAFSGPRRHGGGFA